ncbi:beta-defensin 127 [Saccopteryx leptura]|uniref:beta-defensin 127 n=1 Tax=Saccopteryx leptura TaxID=249018 RepID=UPI00339D2C99
MRLLLIIAVLLFQKPTATEQLQKCWNQYIHGTCRKICRVSEVREVLCENGRYCCVSVLQVEARRKLPKPTRPRPRTYALTLPQDYDHI